MPTAKLYIGKDYFKTVGCRKGERKIVYRWSPPLIVGVSKQLKWFDFIFEFHSVDAKQVEAKFILRDICLWPEELPRE